MQKKAFVSNIQRFSIHDGPGIRTVVFFQGCPLACKWCQNPESISFQPSILFDESKCIGCGYCVAACPRNAIKLRPGITIDRKKCVACGACAEQCYPKALELCGKKYTVDELLEELLRDETVFLETAGGVTLSGGEPTAQGEFAARLLQKLKARGIHTAMETCGYVDWDTLWKLAQYTDLFLYDIKMIGEEAHIKWTGRGNERILENARRLTKEGKDLIVRVPLVPGVSDGEEFKRIAQFAAGLKENQELHIMPFRLLGANKYRLLDQTYGCMDFPEPEDEELFKYKEYAQELGLKVNIGGMGFSVTYPDME